MKIEKYNDILREFISKFPLLSLIGLVILIGLGHALITNYFGKVKVEVVTVETIIEEIVEVEVPLLIQTVVIDRPLFIEKPIIIEKIIIHTVVVPDPGVLDAESQ